MSKVLQSVAPTSNRLCGTTLDAAILERLGRHLRQIYEPILQEGPDARIAAALRNLKDRDGIDRVRNVQRCGSAPARPEHVAFRA
ncbi:hypothetical protein U8607_06590 [Methylobacterium durans]|uniref:hypothetical protein n=1 Tax=Methylobacterium durans TaxID=2202825 RepID=UPI002AFFB823|nr:hypothetical protein [Methylobacterium durans]MEA1831749.1 hypothetical protein [Methylobacterium durans]